MQDILLRLRQQQLEDLEEESSSGSGGDGSESDEELVKGFSLNRAILVAQVGNKSMGTTVYNTNNERFESKGTSCPQSRVLRIFSLQGDLSVDDLTPEELAAFERQLASGEAATAVQAWEPWWLTPAAAELELSPSGTKLIQELEPLLKTEISQTMPSTPPPQIKEEQVEESLDISQPEGVLPPPPPMALPPLSSLISKPPSPVLSLHLLDLIYSYCLVLRLFNGQYTTDPLEAAATLLDASRVLGPSKPPGSYRPAPISASMSPTTVLLDCVVHVCGPEARSCHVPRSFAVGILSDVARVLELGRAVVVTALLDLSRIVDAGLGEARTAGAQQHKELISKLKQAHRKLLFFLSWANERAEDVCPALAAAATVAFSQQRDTLVGSSNTTQTPIIVNE